ncbi:acyltransferase family protein [Pantoea eucrina]|uniref:acyltransferase family protein n=1 Tax=Pantoea eucrina TaxID=472693 RepID=UPI00080F5516|nr:acyltransferase [Pantoea eucrina]
MLTTWHHTAWAFFSIMLAGVIFSSRIFSFMDKDVSAYRIKRMDGLRYVLAALVAMHHFVFSHNQVVLGNWNIEGFFIEYFSGKFAVMIFFMISGYLFISVCEKETDWIKLYVNRFFRIVPMATVSSLLCVVIAALLQLHTGKFFFSDNILYWFDGGIMNIRPDLFGYKKSFLLSGGVTWSLVWEWALYFSLPFIYFLNFRKNTIVLLLSIIFICYYALSKYEYRTALYIATFAIGALCKKMTTLQDKINSHEKIFSWLSLPLFAACFAFGYKENPITLSITVMYGLFFYSICCGGKLAGVLEWKGFIRLGDASFSIYLLHSTFWFVMNKLANHFSLTSDISKYYLLSTLSWILICGVSCLAYHFIEIPFIKLGKRLVKR